MEAIYNCFTIPGFQDNFYKKSLPIINLYIFPIALIDLNNNMTIDICSVCSVKNIFLFQGLVAAIPLAFIIPALCYMKLEEGPLLSQKKGPALLLALFGIAVTTFGTIVIMTKVIKNCSILHNF